MRLRCVKIFCFVPASVALTGPSGRFILAAMMGLIIDCLYAAGLLVSSPIWLYRMVRHGRYREDVSQRLGEAPVRHGLQPVIWIHAVSLGEVNGVRALVDELASQLPDYQIVISSTTDTGMTQARKLFSPKRKTFRFPFDFSWAVRRAFGRLRPDLVVLMEGEIWPNFLARANRLDVPVVLVNGRMSRDKGYPGYKRVRWFTKRLFNRLRVLAVQDQTYAECFIELGTDSEKVRVTGTMKYDTAVVADSVAGAGELAAAIGLKRDAGEKLIVAGGTGPGEEKLLLEIFETGRANGEFDDRTRLAIVPRKPERFDEVAALIGRTGLEFIRRSQTPDGQAPTAGAPVILGDTMGELRKFYSLADAVFVGRSLVPMGGSDMIEAAALGKAVAFGEHGFNFPPAEALLAAGVARQVEDVDQLRQTLAEWLTDPAAACEMGRKAQQFVRSHQGATRRNVEMICDVLGRVPAERPGNIATRKIKKIPDAGSVQMR